MRLIFASMISKQLDEISRRHEREEIADALEKSTEPALAIGRHRIPDDPYQLGEWNQAQTPCYFLHVCDPPAWRRMTGRTSPYPPLTETEYLNARVPWFANYAEDCSQESVQNNVQSDTRVKAKTSSIRNCRYWIHVSKSMFRKQIAVLREVIAERLLPTFASIENEAQTISDKESERLIRQLVPIPTLLLQRKAENAGITHYLTLVDAKQGLLNLFAVALHHLVEQQQLMVLRQELVDRSENVTARIFKLDEFVDRLAALNIEVKKFDSWPEIEELCYVANAVKHAEGRSAEWLRDHHPEIFVSPSLGAESHLAKSPNKWLFQPLCGQDIFVTANHLKRYFNAAESFWQEFEEALSSHAGETT